MTQPTLCLPGIGPQSFVVITGGGGVLGAELAAGLVRLGARVGLIGRSSPALQEAARRCTGPGQVFTATGDVASRESIRAAVGELLAVGGPPTGLVNMAALISATPEPGEVPEDEIDTLLSVNVKGSFEAVRACMPAMKEAGHGRVVLVSSVAAHRARAGSPVYGASKAAVLRLTQQLAFDLGPHGIRVNCMSPGQTPTQLTLWNAPDGSALEDGRGAPSGSAAKLPLRRRGRAEDYVGPVMFLLSDLSDYVTGVDIAVDGGLLACL
jgi:NAD(P)-dependent dehydrogenase (short-subunit alcohol dehydrogenase family)